MKGFEVTSANNPQITQGRLVARPTLLSTKIMPPGLQPLELDSSRDGLLYIPTTYHVDKPSPLIVMLHGAGGTAISGLAPLLPLAETAGLILLAPDSRQQTWDVILSGYGADVAFIDQALAQVFQQCIVDTAHLAIAGFSDGASYALSLGLTNGDLFTHIIAFSPGFISVVARHGMPHIYVSHGIHDIVLPIEQCSRRIVRRLQSENYNIRYHEFEGPHTVPATIAREAVDWFTPTS